MGTLYVNWWGAALTYTLGVLSLLDIAGAIYPYQRVIRLVTIVLFELMLPCAVFVNVYFNYNAAIPHEEMMVGLSGYPTAVLVPMLLLVYGIVLLQFARVAALPFNDGATALTITRLVWLMATLIAEFALFFSLSGLKDDGQIVHKTTTGVYFSVVTWTTVGYGDVTPWDSYSRYGACIEALTGYVAMALLISSIVQILTTRGAKAAQ